MCLKDESHSTSVGLIVLKHSLLFVNHYQQLDSVEVQQTIGIVSCSKGSGLVLETDLDFCKNKRAQLIRNYKWSTAVKRFHSCWLFSTNTKQFNFSVLLDQRVHSCKRKHLLIPRLSWSLKLGFLAELFKLLKNLILIQHTSSFRLVSEVFLQKAGASLQYLQQSVLNRLSPRMLRYTEERCTASVV